MVVTCTIYHLFGQWNKSLCGFDITTWFVIYFQTFENVYANAKKLLNDILLSINDNR